MSTGNVAIGGVAWAQHTGIAKVEVRIDDGDWDVASWPSTRPSTPGASGRIVWEATTGTHDIAVRATDESGYTQTGDRHDVVPDGATGWHTIRVYVH